MAAEPSFLSELTEVQTAQLNAALTFHALANPGSLIEVNVSVGDISQVPALTDGSTVDGSAGAAATLLGALRITSRAVGSLLVGYSGDLVHRAVRIAHPQATPATTLPPAPQSIPRRVYRELERRAPLTVDAIRESVMNRRQRAISDRLARYPDGPSDAQADVIAAWKPIPSMPPAGAPRAVLFGLHWLQTGGAEHWAIESIQLARQAGFLPIVVTDQNSVHPWLTRPELEGALVIALSFTTHEHPLDIGLSHALLENYDLRGVVIHHSKWLYQSLPWILRHRPGIPVLDSLHIVEYLGGGYPGLAASYDSFIDMHHVISPQLVSWLTEVQGISPEKIALAPLTALTVDQIAGFAPRANDAPITISFVGRLSRQKRPDVFLGLVNELRKREFPFRAILHGDGEMREIVDGLLDRYGLATIIEQRFEDTPVADTLAESDVLIVTSINEGLTLTTFEAVAAGIPVISTDVGSQRTIVRGEALFPRPARPFIRGAATLVERLAADESLRESLWEKQRAQVTEFSALPTAHHFMKELFASWQA